VTEKDVLVEVTNPTLNAEGGEAALDRLLADPRPPTAIFCVNDVTALGVLRGLLRRGLSVPEDVALVGYDDVEFAGLLATPLTSVRQPKYQLGRAAADLLLAEAADGPGHRHQQLLFQPELVVRASSAPAAQPPV
jgi:LacI family transcriptional regulator